MTEEYAPPATIEQFLNNPEEMERAKGACVYIDITSYYIAHQESKTGKVKLPVKKASGIDSVLSRKKLTKRGVDTTQYYYLVNFRICGLLRDLDDVLASTFEGLGGDISSLDDLDNFGQDYERGVFAYINKEAKDMKHPIYVAEKKRCPRGGLKTTERTAGPTAIDKTRDGQQIFEGLKANPVVSFKFNDKAAQVDVSKGLSSAPPKAKKKSAKTRKVAKRPVRKIQDLSAAVESIASTHTPESPVAPVSASPELRQGVRPPRRRRAQATRRRKLGEPSASSEEPEQPLVSRGRRTTPPASPRTTPPVSPRTSPRRSVSPRRSPAATSPRRRSASPRRSLLGPGAQRRAAEEEPVLQPVETREEGEEFEAGGEGFGSMLSDE